MSAAAIIPAGRKVCRGCAADLARPGRRLCARCLGDDSEALLPILDNAFLPVGYAPPRISEVPAPQSSEAQAFARSITAWVGLLLLFAFACGLTCGWAFARVH